LLKKLHYVKVLGSGRERFLVLLLIVLFHYYPQHQHTTTLYAL